MQGSTFKCFHSFLHLPCFSPFKPSSFRYFSCFSEWKFQCDNVQCQQVVRRLFWPKKKEKGSTAWGLWGSFLTFSQETNSSFGARDFDADCSLWRMSSLITSEIHLHLPPPQNLPPVCTPCVCQLKSRPWLLYVPQIKLPAVCESAGWVVFFI